ASAGGLAHGCEEPVDGPGHGQSHLAATLRPRSGPDAERLRTAGQTTVASRIARLACGPFHRWRLVHQDDAPAHIAVEYLSTGQHRSCRQREVRSGERLSLEAHPATARRRGNP